MTQPTRPPHIEFIPAGSQVDDRYIKAAILDIPIECADGEYYQKRCFECGFLNNFSHSEIVDLAKSSNLEVVPDISYLIPSRQKANQSGYGDLILETPCCSCQIKSRFQVCFCYVIEPRWRVVKITEDMGRMNVDQAE